jgi:hypothetical protein
MREILSVYAQGEAAGATRGAKAGLTAGALATVSVVALVLAALMEAGLIQFTPPPAEPGTTAAPPRLETGPVGPPSSGIVAPLVPGLPPGADGK